MHVKQSQKGGTHEAPTADKLYMESNLLRIAGALFVTVR
jgi:hypothetical protein